MSSATRRSAAALANGDASSALSLADSVKPATSDSLLLSAKALISLQQAHEACIRLEQVLSLESVGESKFVQALRGLADALEQRSDAPLAEARVHARLLQLESSESHRAEKAFQRLCELLPQLLLQSDASDRTHHLTVVLSAHDAWREECAVAAASFNDDSYATADDPVQCASFTSVQSLQGCMRSHYSLLPSTCRLLISTGVHAHAVDASVVCLRRLLACAQGLQYASFHRVCAWSVALDAACAVAKQLRQQPTSQQTRSLADWTALIAAGFSEEVELFTYSVPVSQGDVDKCTSVPNDKGTSQHHALSSTSSKSIGNDLSSENMLQQCESLLTSIRQYDLLDAASPLYIACQLSFRSREGQLDNTSVRAHDCEASIPMLASRPAGPGAICWHLGEALACNCDWHYLRKICSKSLQVLKPRREAGFAEYKRTEQRLQIRMCEASLQSSPTGSRKATEALAKLANGDALALSRLAKQAALSGDCAQARKKAQETYAAADSSERNSGPFDSGLAILADAYAHWCDGHLQDAAKFLEKAISSSRSLDTPENKLMLADICMELGGERANNKKFAHAHLLAVAKSGPDAMKSQAMTRLSTWYFQHSDKRRSMQCIRKAIEMDPGNVQAAETSAEMEHREGKLSDDTVRSLQTALSQAGVVDADRCFKLADYATEIGMNDTVIWAYQRAIRASPNDAHLWELLGRAYASDGRIASSVKALRQSLQFNAQRTSALTACANQELLDGYLHEALGHINAAMKLESESVETLVTKVKTLNALANSSTREGAYARAVSLQDAACDIVRTSLTTSQCDDKETLKAVQVAGTTLLERAKLAILFQDAVENAASIAQESVEYLQKRVKIYPSERESWDELASACLIASWCKEENISIGEHAAAAALDIDECSSRSWHLRGLLEKRWGKTNAAISLIVRALHTNRANCEAWLDLASFERSKETSDEAINNARASDPQSARVWDLMGSRFHESGHYQDAFASFRMSRDLHGGPIRDVRFANEGYMLGYSFAYESDMFASALRASAAIPQSPDAWMLRAIGLCERRLRREAREIVHWLQSCKLRGSAELEQECNSLLSNGGEKCASDVLQAHMDAAIHQKASACDCGDTKTELSSWCNLCKRRARHIDPSLQIGVNGNGDTSY